MTSMNQGLFSTTMEAEKRDPGNEVGACNALIPLAHTHVQVHFTIVVISSDCCESH